MSVRYLYQTKITADYASEKSDYAQVKTEVADKIRDMYELLSTLSAESREKHIHECITKHLDETHPYVEECSQDGKMNYIQLESLLFKDLHEYGFLTEVLKNPRFNDIECFGIGKGNLVCSHMGKKQPLTDINGKELYFTKASEVRDVINKLSFTSQERLSRSTPIIRCETIQGYRLTAQDSSLTYQYEDENGNTDACPTFSIRLKSNDTITVKDMVQEKKSIAMPMVEALRALMSLPAYNLVFSGVPGTGKTTLLNEMSYETPDLVKIYISRTKEFDPFRVRADGSVVQNVKVWISTVDKDESGDMSVATVKNLYYSALSCRHEVLILGEIRSTEEIVVYLESAVSGTSAWTSIHGADEQTTAERMIKNVMDAKSVDRMSAIEEVVLSLNAVVGMQDRYPDNRKRVGYISEIYKTEDTNGRPQIGFNRLFEFRVLSPTINADGFCDGAFCKVGTPSANLLAKLENNMTDKSIINMFKSPATPETPIFYTGGDAFVYSQ